MFTPSPIFRFKDIQRLKINNPQLKTMLSVGGWDVGSLPFSILVSDSSSIREFAETTTKFLREHGFDGLDVDWRFPTQRGGQRQDGARFTLLLKDIRVEFERESVESGKTRLMLSVVVGSSKSVVDYGYEILEVTKYRWTADYWLKKVPDPAVVNLGLSFHAVTFLLTSLNNDSLGAPASGPGRVGTFTFTKGRLAFFEVCLLQALGARKKYEASYQVPYLVHRDLWVAYEDRDSLTAKVRFIREVGVGGVAVWYIDEDDFGGTFCHLGSYPLLKLVSKELHVNFINFATFDQHGTWEEVKEHHSPLFSSSPAQVNGRALSASKATEIMKKSGIPMWKVNFGVSFFARSYTVSNSSKHVSSGKAGNHTGQKGFLAYFEVCELLKKGATIGWISDQVVPFLTFGDQWVAFDNQRSINEKVQYAMKSGYGGLAVWTVDVDDFSGQFCQQGPFPLLQTLLSSCSRYSSVPQVAECQDTRLPAAHSVQEVAGAVQCGKVDNNRHSSQA
ncbi:hypothetical protein C0Q70_02170 [Pomacea canaliculata]|uniref:GH18 domain-containing protein n=1 Tax=Pomacea canaliculata TaxID=400727 RepID=A0A2T7Q1K8_POMCA|nr:hypothetical protein C0Q70_02170 [Pomacea canaliculata]